MRSAFCTGCGEPLTVGGSLCVRCGTENPGPPPMAPGGSPAAPPPPSVPVLGFRHPRDKGSTLLVVVVLVAALLVAVSFSSFLFYSLLGCGNGCPGASAIGNGFKAGNPTLGQCPGGDTFAANGCDGPTHSYYQIRIVASSVTFGEVWLQVLGTNGAPYVAPGGLGFSVLSQGGVVLAQYGTTGGILAMTSGWMYAPGISNATALSTACSLAIDMGTGNPAEQGLGFVAFGTGSYSGTTATLALP